MGGRPAVANCRETAAADIKYLQALRRTTLLHVVNHACSAQERIWSLLIMYTSFLSLLVLPNAISAARCVWNAKPESLKLVQHSSFFLHARMSKHRALTFILEKSNSRGLRLCFVHSSSITNHHALLFLEGDAYRQLACR